MFRRLHPSSGSHRVGSPPSLVERDAPTPDRSSRQARLLRSPVPQRARRSCLPPIPSALERPRVFGVRQPGIAVLTAETIGSPRFLGEPLCARASPEHPGWNSSDQVSTADGARPSRVPTPWASTITSVFGAEQLWLTHSLSTLRRPGYPSTTQDSLPAGDQPLPGRIPTCQVRFRRFQKLHDSHHVISFPSSRLSLSHVGWARAVTRPGLPQIRTCALTHTAPRKHSFATPWLPMAHPLVQASSGATAREVHPAQFRYPSKFR